MHQPASVKSTGLSKPGHLPSYGAFSRRGAFRLRAVFVGASKNHHHEPAIVIARFTPCDVACAPRFRAFSPLTFRRLFFPAPFRAIWKTTPSHELGPVTDLPRERVDHLSHARPYDFCNCHIHLRHTGTSMSVGSSRSKKGSSSEFSSRRGLAPAV